MSISPFEAGVSLNTASLLADYGSLNLSSGQFGSPPFPSARGAAVNGGDAVILCNPALALAAKDCFALERDKGFRQLAPGTAATDDIGGFNVAAVGGGMLVMGGNNSNGKASLLFHYI